MLKERFCFFVLIFITGSYTLAEKCVYHKLKKITQIKPCSQAIDLIFKVGWQVDGSQTIKINKWPNSSVNFINNIKSGIGNCAMYKMVYKETEDCCSGWMGENCDIETCSHPCVHGSCTGPNTCTCVEAWSGRLCDENIKAVNDTTSYCYTGSACKGDKVFNASVVPKDKCCSDGRDTSWGHQGQGYTEGQCLSCLKEKPHAVSVTGNKRVPFRTCVSGLACSVRTFDGVTYNYCTHCTLHLLHTSDIIVSTYTDLSSATPHKERMNELLQFPPIDDTRSISRLCKKLRSISEDPKVVTIRSIYRQIRYTLTNDSVVMSADNYGEHLEVVKIGDIHEHAIQIGELEVNIVGDSVFINMPRFDLRVRRDNYMQVFITVGSHSSLRKDHINGACGNYDDDISDEVKLANNHQEARKFGLEWTDESCPSRPRETKYSSEMKNAAEAACSVLSSKLFERCHSLIDVEPYVQSCIEAYCLTKHQNDTEVTETHCKAVGAYASVCALEDVVIQWRTDAFCPKHCPENMVYRQCGPSCKPTCGYPLASYLKHECDMCCSGCHCQEGLVLHNGVCIEPTDCPCVYKTDAYDFGQALYINETCQMCTCGHFGHWDCKVTPCLATCSVYGPGVLTTFDGEEFRLGTHNKTCDYTLVSVLKSKLEIKLQARISEYKTSAVHATGFEVKSEKQHFSVELTQLGQFRFFDLETNTPANLPFLRAGVYVRQSTGSSVLADFSGFRLMFDANKYLTISTDESTHFGIVRGLCGNLNNLISDERLLPSGVEAFSDNIFVAAFSDNKCGLIVSPPQQTENHQQCESLKLLYLAFNQSESTAENVYRICMTNPDQQNICAAIFKLIITADISLTLLLDYQLDNMQIMEACTDELKYCEVGQVYRDDIDLCTTNCLDLVFGREKCQRKIIRGCACADGFYRNNNGSCVPKSQCSCLNIATGKYYNPGLVQEIPCHECNCTHGRLHCEEKGCDKIVCPKDQVPFITKHASNVECLNYKCPDKYANQITCADNSSYTKKCVCKKGYVMTQFGTCVQFPYCPCYHEGVWHKNGTEIVDKCFLKRCNSGMWMIIQKTKCQATCFITGSETQIETFDGTAYSFNAKSSYTLVKTQGDAQGFQISFRNLACGSNERACSHKVDIDFMGIHMELVTGAGVIVGNKTYSVDEPVKIGIFKVMSTTLYLVVSFLDVTVYWSGGLLTWIKVSSRWDSKLEGLCGTYDYNTKNDFRKPDGSVDSDVWRFTESWEKEDILMIHKNESSPCQYNPGKMMWSSAQCNIIKSSEAFQQCRDAMPQSHIDRYVADCEKTTCWCNGDSDSDCLCDTIAHFAAVCDSFGHPVVWRHQHFCPVQCGGDMVYSPSHIPCKTTCLDVINNSTQCDISAGVEGCFCPPGKIWHESKCIPAAQCPCYDGMYLYDSGTVLKKGCNVCICEEGKFVCRQTNCSECLPDEFKCRTNGMCIHQSDVCNGIFDCYDGSDESSDLCNKKNCSSEQFQCRLSGECIHSSQLCDGVAHCDDGSDEDKDQCKIVCDYRCHDGRCLYKDYICDGYFDCIDGSDELGCAEACEQGHFKCNKSGVCIRNDYVCDGHDDCGDGADELRCTTVTASSRTFVEQETRTVSLTNVTGNPITLFSTELNGQETSVIPTTRKRQTIAQTSNESRHLGTISGNGVTYETTTKMSSSGGVHRSISIPNKTGFPESNNPPEGPLAENGTTNSIMTTRESSKVTEASISEASPGTTNKISTPSQTYSATNKETSASNQMHSETLAETTPETSTTYQTPPEATTPYQTSPEASTTYQTSPEASTTYQTSPEPSTTYQTSPEAPTTYHTSPEASTTYQKSPETSTTYQTSTETSTTYQTSPEASTTYQTSPEASTTYQTSPEAATTYQTSPEASTTCQTSPETSTTYQTSPETSTTYQTSPETYTTYQTSPETSTTYQTSPEASTTYQTSPEASTTYQTSPEPSTTYQTSPEASTTYKTSPEASTTYKTSPKVLSDTTLETVTSEQAECEEDETTVETSISLGQTAAETLKSTQAIPTTHEAFTSSQKHFKTTLETVTSKLTSEAFHETTLETVMSSKTQNYTMFESSTLKQTPESSMKTSLETATSRQTNSQTLAETIPETSTTHWTTPETTLQTTLEISTPAQTSSKYVAKTSLETSPSSKTHTETIFETSTSQQKTSETTLETLTSNLSHSETQTEASTTQWTTPEATSVITTETFTSSQTHPKTILDNSTSKQTPTESLVETTLQTVTSELKNSQTLAETTSEISKTYQTTPKVSSETTLESFTSSQKYPETSLETSTSSVKTTLETFTIHWTTPEESSETPVETTSPQINPKSISQATAETLTSNQAVSKTTVQTYTSNQTHPETQSTPYKTQSTMPQSSSETTTETLTTSQTNPTIILEISASTQTSTESSAEITPVTVTSELAHSETQAETTLKTPTTYQTTPKVLSETTLETFTSEQEECEENETTVETSISLGQTAAETLKSTQAIPTTHEAFTSSQKHFKTTLETFTSSESFHETTRETVKSSKTQNYTSFESSTLKQTPESSIETSLETSPEASTTYQTSPEASTTYQTSPEASTTYQTSPEASTTCQTSPETSTTYQTSPQTSTTYQTSLETATTRQTNSPTLAETIPETSTTHWTTAETTLETTLEISTPAQTSSKSVAKTSRETSSSSKTHTETIFDTSTSQQKTSESLVETSLATVTSEQPRSETTRKTSTAYQTTINVSPETTFETLTSNLTHSETQTEASTTQWTTPETSSAKTTETVTSYKTSPKTVLENSTSKQTPTETLFETTFQIVTSELTNSQTLAETTLETSKTYQTTPKASSETTLETVTSEQTISETTLKTPTTYRTTPKVLSETTLETLTSSQSETTQGEEIIKTSTPLSLTTATTTNPLGGIPNVIFKYDLRTPNLTNPQTTLKTSKQTPEYLAPTTPVTVTSGKTHPETNLEVSTSKLTSTESYNETTLETVKSSKTQHKTVIESSTLKQTPESPKETIFETVTSMQTISDTSAETIPETSTSHWTTPKVASETALEISTSKQTSSKSLTETTIETVPSNKWTIFETSKQTTSESFVETTSEAVTPEQTISETGLKTSTTYQTTIKVLPETTLETLTSSQTHLETSKSSAENNFETSTTHWTTPEELSETSPEATSTPLTETTPVTVTPELTNSETRTETSPKTSTGYQTTSEALSETTLETLTSEQTIYETTPKTSTRYQTTPEALTETTLGTLTSEQTIYETTPKTSTRYQTTPEALTETTLETLTSEQTISETTPKTSTRYQTTPEALTETTLGTLTSEQTIYETTPKTSTRYQTTPEALTETTLETLTSEPTVSETAFKTSTRYQTTPKTSSETTLETLTSEQTICETTPKIPTTYQTTPKVISETTLKTFTSEKAEWEEDETTVETSISLGQTAAETLKSTQAIPTTHKAFKSSQEHLKTTLETFTSKQPSSESLTKTTLATVTSSKTQPETMIFKTSTFEQTPSEYLTETTLKLGISKQTNSETTLETFSTYQTHNKISPVTTLKTLTSSQRNLETSLEASKFSTETTLESITSKKTNFETVAEKTTTHRTTPEESSETPLEAISTQINPKPFSKITAETLTSNYTVSNTTLETLTSKQTHSETNHEESTHETTLEASSGRASETFTPNQTNPEEPPASTIETFTSSQAYHETTLETFTIQHTTPEGSTKHHTTPEVSSETTPETSVKTITFKTLTPREISFETTGETSAPRNNNPELFNETTIGSLTSRYKNPETTTGVYTSAQPTNETSAEITFESFTSSPATSETTLELSTSRQINPETAAETSKATSFNTNYKPSASRLLNYNTSEFEVTVQTTVPVKIMTDVNTTGQGTHTTEAFDNIPPGTTPVVYNDTCSSDCLGPWSCWSACPRLCRGVSVRIRAQDTDNSSCICNGAILSEARSCSCNQTSAPKMLPTAASGLCPCHSSKECTSCFEECEQSCRAFRSKAFCDKPDECSPGCKCPDGQLMDNDGFCTPSDYCPCYDTKGTEIPYNSTYIDPGSCKICQCSEHGSMCEDRQKEFEVLYEWDPWSDWSTCSSLCGNGTSSRYRTGQHYGCSTRHEEYKPCSSKECHCLSQDGVLVPEGQTYKPHECTICRCFKGDLVCNIDPNSVVNGEWEEWSRWSSCQGNCSLFTKTRSRYYKPPNCGGQILDGASIETHICSSEPCCDVFKWSDWTLCTQTCGRRPGSRSKHKIYTDLARDKCEGYIHMETCGLCSCDDQNQDWSEWTSCANEGAVCGWGKRTRHRSVSDQCVRNGVEATQTEPCFMGPCNCSSHLVWSNNSLCEQKCHMDRPADCSLHISGGCVCPNSLFSSGSNCVSNKNCPNECVYNNITYQDGQHFNCDSCKTCQCVRGQIEKLNRKECPDVRKCNLSTHRLVPSRDGCCLVDCVPQETCTVHQANAKHVKINNCRSAEMVTQQFCAGPCPTRSNSLDYSTLHERHLVCPACSPRNTVYKGVEFKCGDGTSLIHPLPFITECSCE